MNDQLKAIIEKIKTDGVRNANEQAAEIIDQAGKKAHEIIEQATKKAEGIISNADKTAEKTVRNGKASLNQAGRDLVLTVRKNIAGIFNFIIHDETKKAYDSKFIQDAVIQALKNWKPEGLSDLKIIIPEEQKDKLLSHFKAKLSSELKKGLEIKAGKTINDGFIIREKQDRYYFDFTASGIADQLSEFLSDSIAGELRNISEKENLEEKE